jgi:ParB family transcriptional regulator, chromosome partitioning protein
MSKNRLGKGLNALINDNNEDLEKNNIVNIFLNQIEENPFQPRQEFDRELLEELAKSIKENGLIQPIIVRKIKPDRYQLVSGERRWRAAGIISLKKIPAIVKDYTDIKMMEIALIENLQREDLNPIEEAHAYQKMIDLFAMTQEEVSQKVGKSRSNIANIVRLLNLAPKVQVYVSRETLSMGHARSLLALKDNKTQIKAADYIINNGLSVRDTERYIHKLNNNEQRNNNIKKKALEPEWLEVQKKLANYLETEVKIKENKNKKIITIECGSFKDIEKLINRISS